MRQNPKNKTDRRNFIKSVGLASGAVILAPGKSRGAAIHNLENQQSEKNEVSLIPNKPNACNIDLGLGFNWFEHLGSGSHYARWIKYPLSEKIYPELDDKAGWQAIEQGLDELNPGWFRFGMPPDQHIDSKGGFVKGTVHFKHLEWLNTWAARKNKVILLDMFLIPRYYEFPVPDGTEDPGENIVNMAAANNRDYARNFVAPMMDYVVNELKLETVKFFNPVNEPMWYGVYQTPENNPPAMAHYVEMYKEIREALDDTGIGRKRIGLVGLDCTDPAKFILEQHSLGIDISPYVEAFSVHHYNLRLDYLPPISGPDIGRNYFVKGMNVVIEQDDKQFLDYAKARNIPLWALEMGTFYYGKFANPEGVAGIDATITVAEGIIRAINTGVTSFCIWSLMNPNSVDGHWAVMGQKDGKLVRYKYPFAIYGLMTNHITPDAKVYPLLQKDAPEISHIHATALENSSNEKTILIVNDHPNKEYALELDLPGNWPKSGIFAKSLVDATRLNESTGSVKIMDGKIKITCPPFCLTGLKINE